MGRGITDADVAGVLRTVVRGCDPVLAGLSDPGRGRIAGLVGSGDLGKRLGPLLERLAAMEVPGGDKWQRMDVDARCEWWLERLGRATALAVAAPGAFGALGGTSLLQDLLGAANQATLLCAIAREHGLAGEDDQVRLLAFVLLDRELDRATVAGAKARDVDELIEEAEAGGEGEEPAAGRALPGKLRTAIKQAWRVGRLMRELEGELSKRPQGRLHHRLMGKIPVVALAGDYRGERVALKRAAAEATEWIARERVSA